LKKSKFHYAWIVVGAGTIGVMGALGLGRFGYTVILPAMKDGLGLSYGQMGLLGTGNLADVSGTFSYSFMLAALVALAGAFGSLLLNKSE